MTDSDQSSDIKYRKYRTHLPSCIVAIVMLLAALGEHNYGYYEALR